MKILMFDTERGAKTLGSDESIQGMFGLPVLAPSTWDGFTDVIKKIYTIQRREVLRDLGDGLTVNEIQENTVLKNGVGIDAFVIDTFSELAKKYQRTLCDQNGRMQMQDWGKLKNKLDQTLEFISRIPGIVVCTVHSKYKDLDDGTTKVLPYIDGSTKEDMAKWFDFVFYSVTVENPSGGYDYVWHTRHNNMYDHAKDRTNTLPEIIPQNFQLVLDAADSKGFDGCKILIIGTPGSGKTMSLKTLIAEAWEDFLPNQITRSNDVS